MPARTRLNSRACTICRRRRAGHCRRPAAAEQRRGLWPTAPLQCLRGAVGIEVDVAKHVFVECLKSGHARKRRRVSADTFKGSIPKAYEVGKFNPVMRQLLGKEDVCAFEAEVKRDVLELRKIECLSYALLKRVADLSGSVEFDMVKQCIRVSLK